MKLYFAGGGYVTGGRALWGVPPIPEGLDLYLAMLGDTGIPWAIALIDGDALAPSAHPRSRSSAAATCGSASRTTRAAPATSELVRAAAALCAEVGRPVATLADTEALLGLPT